YTNVDALKETEIKGTKTMKTLEDLGGITLKPSKYIGIALPAIEKISSVQLDRSSADSTLQVSENGVEWQDISSEAPYPNAAYVRLVNKTDEEITFDLNKLEVELNKFIEPSVTDNYDSVYEGKAQNLFDGNLNTKTWFGSMQNKGTYVQVDMGGLVNVNDVAVAIDDGEGDYFRQGDLQISKDGDNWTTVHTFNNPGDRSLNFP